MQTLNCPHIPFQLAFISRVNSSTRNLAQMSVYFGATIAKIKRFQESENSSVLFSQFFLKTVQHVSISLEMCTGVNKLLNSSENFFEKEFCFYLSSTIIHRNCRFVKTKLECYRALVNLRTWPAAHRPNFNSWCIWCSFFPLLRNWIVWVFIIDQPYEIQ